MRAFDPGEYPRAWTLGVDGPSTEPPVWRRVVGPLCVDVSMAGSPLYGVHNIRLTMRGSNDLFASARVLGDDYAALMETAQRMALRALKSQLCAMQRGIIDYHDDVMNQPTPEEAVATTPSKTKP